jgi:hypothetical protein
MTSKARRKKVRKVISWSNIFGTEFRAAGPEQKKRTFTKLIALLGTKYKAQAIVSGT